MCEIVNHSKRGIAAAIILLGIASSPAANAANILVDGWFSQPSQPNGSPVCTTGPASSSTAAVGWSQWAVVPHSHMCTYLEFTFLPRIRVRTNGGDSPPAAMGNGFGQNFKPITCAKATYWYNVVSGQVTGNLVRADIPAFIDFKSVLQPSPNNPNAWKPFTSWWNQGAQALDFETLSPIGITSEVNYQIMDAQVEPCSSVPQLKDIVELACEYPGCLPYYELADPTGPIEKFRVVNTTGVAVQGPIHVLIEELPAGRAVVNPDGDYLGTPYFDLASSSLEPGQSEVVTIQFNAISTGEIPKFRVRFASGDL